MTENAGTPIGGQIGPPAAVGPVEPTAYDLLLNRPEAEDVVRKHCADLSEVLREVVDYGTHLIPRCWQGSEKKLLDVVVLQVLLKQVVALVDAGQVLIQSGCVEPALLQTRAAFEASVYIEWLLKRDSKRRARAYYVAAIRRRLRWAKRARHGTDERRELRKELKTPILESHLDTREQQAQIADEIRRVEDRLNARDLRSMDKAFSRRKGKGRYDRDWYVAALPHRKKGRGATLYTLAKQVDRRAQYRLIYEQGSEEMHSARMDKAVRVHPGGTLGMRALRDLTDIGLVSQWLVAQAFYTYKAILTFYRPSERENFARKYRQQWQQVVMNPPKVQYEYELKPLG